MAQNVPIRLDEKQNSLGIGRGGLWMYQYEELFMRSFQEKGRKCINTS